MKAHLTLHRSGGQQLSMAPLGLPPHRPARAASAVSRSGQQAKTPSLSPRKGGK
ncbi:hypothetical protein P7K49_011886, partial [Saguinus oedipus]